MKKGELTFGEKTSEADLEKILPQLPIDLPKSYIDFLKNYNGASGDLPIQPFCFEIWQINEIVEANKDAEIQKYLPNYFGIGGNGGGELIAINLKTKKIYAIPFIVMEEQDAWLIAESFEEFQNLIGYSE